METSSSLRCYALQFMSHWFYNIFGLGRRALPEPVPELTWLGQNMTDPQGFMTTAQAALKRYLIQSLEEKSIAESVVASGYYLFQEGSRMWIGDSWYGNKVFIGRIPKDPFIAYLNNGSFRIEGKEVRADPTCYRIKSLDDAMDVLSTGRHKRYIDNGQLSFRGQTREHFVQRPVPNPFMRTEDGKERLALPAFWRRYSGKWNERFRWRPTQLLRANLGDPQVYLLAGGIDVPIDDLRRWKELPLPDIAQDAAAAQYAFDPSFNIPLVQQHYGFPTSGLDVTFDLKTALFFASHAFVRTSDGKGHYNPLSPHEMAGVVYCFRFIDPPLKSTSSLVTEVGVFEKYPPVRPLRQSCALPQFDSLAINEAMADLDAILILDQDFDPSGIPSAPDLFPSRNDDPFYRVILEAKTQYPNELSDVVSYSY